jgi:hypothetical protein
MRMPLCQACLQAAENRAPKTLVMEGSAYLALTRCINGALTRIWLPQLPSQYAHAVCRVPVQLRPTLSFQLSLACSQSIIMLRTFLAVTIVHAMWSSSCVHVAASWHDAAPKVKVDVYMESLCPFCAHFMVKKLPFLFINELSSIFELSVTPWVREPFPSLLVDPRVQTRVSLVSRKFATFTGLNKASYLNSQSVFTAELLVFCEMHYGSSHGLLSTLNPLSQMTTTPEHRLTVVRAKT